MEYNELPPVVTHAPRRSGCLPSTIVVGVLLILFMVLANVWMARTHGQHEGGRSIANCRQIIIAIRLFAADEGGRYPDSFAPGAKDSNSAFRQLFVGGSLEDEKIFGCGASKYIPDGEIGSAPTFSRALEPGENHWAMTKGLNDKTAGGIPLVYENPLEAAWEPLWNADAAGKPVKGRAWTGGKIIVGTNDTSVELTKLASPTGPRVPLKALGDEGKNLFSQYDKKEDGTPYEILDIAP